MNNDEMNELRFKKRLTPPGLNPNEELLAEREREIADWYFPIKEDGVYKGYRELTVVGMAKVLRTLVNCQDRIAALEVKIAESQK